MTPRARDPYDQPADPWGDAQRWDDVAQHDAPDYGAAGYAATEYRGTEDAGTEYRGTEYRGTEYRGTEYRANPAPPERSSTRLIVAIVAVLTVLLAGGTATVIYLARGDGKPAASPSAPPESAGAAQAGAGPGAPTGQTGTPAPESSTEARFAAAGQCLVNDGTEATPSMRIVACARNTYQVLARFDGTTDYAGRCATVKGYQFHFYFDGELDSLDYVLCLKKR